MTDVGNSGCGGCRMARRDFLRVGSLGLLGIGLDQYLRAANGLAPGGGPIQGKAQACILVWLEGGPSQMDTWDPKSTSPFKPIATKADGVQISDLFPKIAGQMDKLSIIRSMRSEEVNHPQGTYYAMTGHRPNPAMNFPSIGSIVAREMGPRNQLPPYVLAPQPRGSDFSNYRDSFMSAFIGSQYDPMIVPDPSQENFSIPDLSLPKSISPELIEHRRSFMRVVDRMFRENEERAAYGKFDAVSEQALAMLSSPTVKTAFDLTQEDEKTRDAYGRDRFGQSVLLARRLVEAGCRFVTASGYNDGAWDTHADNDKRLREVLSPTLDRTLSTLLEDLARCGLLDSTIVLVMGEFGRTPHINPKGGRDHWSQCWSLMVGGGGIAGGRVVGASDETAGAVTERMTSIGDLFATIYKAFGIDWEKTYMHPIGRPVKIANSIDDKTGIPIHELV